MKLLVRLSLFGIALLLIIAGGVQWVQSGTPQAAAQPPRKKEILVTFTQHFWWLARWQDNQALCTIRVEHEGLPTNLEVLADCGKTVYQQWIATPPCDAAAAGGPTDKCKGLYLYYLGYGPGERKLVIDLPHPTVKLTLAGCLPTPPLNECEQLPALVFTGEEPLPNEQITALHIRVGDLFYDCPGQACQIPMTPTPITGVDVEFWADSTFGDQTDHYEARVRIVDGGISRNRGTPVWLVDVISSQWQGTNLGSCAVTWESFPPLGDLPNWLTTPALATDLATDVPFVYLAGQLISFGIVDATACEQDGLLTNGAANMCGLQAARSQVNNWQDYFDQRIMEVAKEKAIPAQLLKNLFAQESQFWPGEIIKDEFGLGQITHWGADATLLWNPDFFRKFCPLVYHQETCALGYAKLDLAKQEVLRGALASSTNANCPGCPDGIDLNHAINSVEVFAETLVANCEQVAYLVYSVTRRVPGAVSTYEDLWRYTLANYNAGPGCLNTALQQAYAREGVLNWQTVSSYLPAACQNAITYVERVTRDRLNQEADFLAATPTPGVPPGVIPVGPQPQATPTRPATSGYPGPVTPTQPAYP